MDRHPLHPPTLELVKHLSTGGSVPPIHVSRILNGRYRIRDGRHRVTAFKLLGRKRIRAKFSTEV